MIYDITLQSTIMNIIFLTKKIVDVVKKLLQLVACMFIHFLNAPQFSLPNSVKK